MAKHVNTLTTRHDHPNLPSTANQDSQTAAIIATMTTRSVSDLKKGDRIFDDDNQITTVIRRGKGYSNIEVKITTNRYGLTADPIFEQSSVYPDGTFTVKIAPPLR